jgi:hypothetical protein
MGKEVVMKKDLDLRPEDVKDKDILISLGKCQSHSIDLSFTIESVNLE